MLTPFVTTPFSGGSANPILKDASDPTKLVAFDVSANSTGTTRTYTLPDASVGLAPLASPAFTGVPTAPTATLGTNTTQVATTAFVLANSGSNFVSPTFTGTIANNGKTVYGNSYTGSVLDDNVSDHTGVTTSTDNSAYCSYDAQPAVSGTAAYNHVAGYQARAQYLGSVSLSDWRGFWSQPVNNGSGTIANVKHFMVVDVAGSGPVTNQFGFYCPILTKGTAGNIYPIFSLATQTAYLSGPVTLGITVASTGNAAADGHFVAKAVGTNNQIAMGWNNTSAYGWIQAAQFGTAYSPAKLNPNGGSIVLGGSLATTATAGFVYVPTCAGTPTGVPVTQTGTAAMVYDTTNNKLCVYNGAWKSVTLA